jgi:2-keto-4-pentenoate hydratase/2-oxohepta-3-ene-1,7-dioic acid hydratase in catechol pathway
VKLARYSAPSMAAPRWGAVDAEAGTVTPLADGFEVIAARVLGGDPARIGGDPVPLGDVRLLAPVEPRAVIVGTGANYLSHLRGRGRDDVPATTVGYLKPWTAIIGPGDEIAYPRTTSQLDYEVELVAVVGRASITAVADGTRHVVGYTVGNDVSARDSVLSIGGVDLFSMKALDRTTPVGPWITTVDEIGDRVGDGVDISLRVNGDERQRDTTKELLFSIDELFAYVTDRVTMHAGDVLFTGTTGGVGKDDGRYLQPGDVVEAEVEGIGVLRNTVGPRHGLHNHRRGR